MISDRSKAFEKVVEACNYILRNDPIAAEARSYVNSRLPENIQNKYQIGFFPKSNNLSYLYSLVDKEYLNKHNIIYNKLVNNNSVLTGHFSDHNLVMPFRDVHGNIISILGRSLLSNEEQKEKQIQKYKYTLNADKELYVYGLNESYPAILQKNCVICVEGQFDFIAAKVAGIDNVVALGWARLSKFQLFQLLKYTNNILLMLDNDEAGTKGKSSAKNRFSKYANIKTISIPSGYKDIDEFLKNNQDLKTRDIIINGLKKLSF